MQFEYSLLLDSLTICSFNVTQVWVVSYFITIHRVSCDFTEFWLVTSARPCWVSYVSLEPTLCRKLVIACLRWQELRRLILEWISIGRWTQHILMPLKSPQIILVCFCMILLCWDCRENNWFTIFLEIVEYFNRIIRSQVTMLLLWLQLLHSCLIELTSGLFLGHTISCIKCWFSCCFIAHLYSIFHFLDSHQNFELWIWSSLFFCAL